MPLTGVAVQVYSVPAPEGYLGDGTLIRWGLGTEAASGPGDGRRPARAAHRFPTPAREASPPPSSWLEDAASFLS